MKISTLLKTTAFALLLTLSLSTARLFADDDNINNEEDPTQTEQLEENQDEAE